MWVFRHATLGTKQLQQCPGYLHSAVVTVANGNVAVTLDSGAGVSWGSWSCMTRIKHFIVQQLLLMSRHTLLGHTHSNTTRWWTCVLNSTKKSVTKSMKKFPSTTSIIQAINIDSQSLGRWYNVKKLQSWYYWKYQTGKVKQTTSLCHIQTLPWIISGKRGRQ